VTHTIAGAFNSINKITGSVSSGLSNLTMDDEYIKEREKMRANKPKHLGQGLEQAGTSLLTGFTSGISG
jgi:vacuolar protein sorting-associated protein 13A/C